MKKNALKHEWTKNRSDRKYIAFAFTAEKLAAEEAAKEARKAERAAERAEAKARGKEARAARLEGTEKAETAKTEAAEARETAEEKREAAKTARAAADYLAALDTAYIAALTVYGKTVQEATAAALRKYEAFTARGIAPKIAALRCYFDPEALNTKNAAEREAAEAVLFCEAPEAVARKAAKKATEREGNETQWKIRRAAEAREHFDPDFFEMISAARIPLLTITNGSEATAEKLEATAAPIIEAAASLDPFIRDSISPDTLRNARADIRAAQIIRDKLASREDFWILDMYRAAYLAVNDHLTLCRSIRTKEAPAPISLEELDPESPDFIVDFDPEAEKEAKERAATLRAAFERVTAILTPTRRNIWKLAAKGYGVNATAAKTKRTEATVREHLAAIRTTAAAVLKDTAPTLAAALLTVDIFEAANAEQIIAAAKTARAAEKAEAAKEAKAAATNTAAEALTATETAEKLRAAVAKLSPIRREIWKHIAKGESEREIAASMKRAKTTVREHIIAIRAALAADMEKDAPTLAEALRAANLQTIAAATEAKAN